MLKVSYRSLRWAPILILVVGVCAATGVGIAQSQDHGSIPKQSRSSETTTVPTTSADSTVTTAPPTTASKAPSNVVSGAPTATWSSLADGLHLDPSVVDCPSAQLCVFTGDTPNPANPGHFEAAIAVSTGPFHPGGTVSGHLTALPNVTQAQLYVSCPATTLCVLSTPSAIYTSTDPSSGTWVQQVTVADQSLGGISCPSASFCAVVTHGGDVLVSRNPTGGSSAWSRSTVSSDAGLWTISCPTSDLCVAGGLLDAGSVYGWVGVSTDPGGGPSTWNGGRSPSPDFAQGPNEYNTLVNCVTTSFCVASSMGLLVTTNPSSGPSGWTRMSVAGPPLVPGIAWCKSTGDCFVSGVGHFATSGTQPGAVGFPWPSVSCVSAAFCLSVDVTGSNQIEIGGATS